MAGPIVGNRNGGFGRRMNEIEVAASITPTDREPLETRLDAAEVAGSIDDPANYKQGLQSRLNDLEDVNWP